MSSILESIDKFLQATLVPFLNNVLGPLDTFLAGLSVETGRWCAAVLFGMAGLWAVTLRREYVYQGAPDRARWRDLRIWSVVVLIPYAVIYVFLF